MFFFFFFSFVFVCFPPIGNAFFGAGKDTATQRFLGNSCAHPARKFAKQSTWLETAMSWLLDEEGQFYEAARCRY